MSGTTNRASSKLSLRLQHAYLELRHVRIQRAGFERLDQRSPRVQRIDDLVDPQAGRAVARIHLLVVGRLHAVEELLLLLIAQLLAAALQLLDLDLDQRAGRRTAAHHRVFGRWATRK